jgi:hypothetical protein
MALYGEHGATRRLGDLAIEDLFKEAEALPTPQKQAAFAEFATSIEDALEGAIGLGREYGPEARNALRSLLKQAQNRVGDFSGAPPAAPLGPPVISSPQPRLRQTPGADLPPGSAYQFSRDQIARMAAASTPHATQPAREVAQEAADPAATDRYQGIAGLFRRGWDRFTYSRRNDGHFAPDFSPNRIDSRRAAEAIVADILANYTTKGKDFLKSLSHDGVTAWLTALKGPALNRRARLAEAILDDVAVPMWERQRLSQHPGHTIANLAIPPNISLARTGIFHLTERSIEKTELGIRRFRDQAFGPRRERPTLSEAQRNELNVGIPTRSDPNTKQLIQGTRWVDRPMEEVIAKFGVNSPQVDFIRRGRKFYNDVLPLMRSVGLAVPSLGENYWPAFRVGAEGADAAASLFGWHKDIRDVMEPFFKKQRTGTGDYMADPARTMDLYINALARKLHLEGPIREAVLRAGSLPSGPTKKGGLAGYAKDYIQRATTAEQLAPWSGGFWGQAVDVYTRASYRGLLASVGTLATNELQNLNTMIEVGPINWVKGIKKWATAAGRAEALEAGVISPWERDAFRRPYSAQETTLGRIESVADYVLYPYGLSEIQLRTTAYHASKAQFESARASGPDAVNRLLRRTRWDVRKVMQAQINAGNFEGAAREYGRETSLKTQFGYGQVYSPTAVRGPWTRSLFQFGQFNANMFARSIDYFRAGDYAKGLVFLGLFGYVGEKVMGWMGLDPSYKFGLLGYLPRGLAPGPKLVQAIYNAAAGYFTKDYAQHERGMTELVPFHRSWNASEALQPGSMKALVPAGRFIQKIAKFYEAMQDGWTLRDSLDQRMRETSVGEQILNLFDLPPREPAEEREVYLDAKWDEDKLRAERRQLLPQVRRGEISRAEARQQGQWQRPSDLMRAMRRERQQAEMTATERRFRSLGHAPYERARQELAEEELPPIPLWRPRRR